MLLSSSVIILPVVVIDVLVCVDIVAPVFKHLDILAIALSFDVANIIALAVVDSAIMEYTVLLDFHKSQFP